MLQIIDGVSDSDPVIGTYCSTLTPPPLITSGHAATVLFHSDYSRQDAGFNIAYSALPGEYFKIFQNDTACDLMKSITLLKSSGINIIQFGHKLLV